jgi:CRP-like cAMP-binding protein
MKTVIEKVIHLQNVELFAEVPSEQLSYIASISNLIELEEGDTLFTRGENSESLHVLFVGSITMQSEGEDKFTVGENETVGALGFFDHKPRIFTAVCNEKCIVLEVDSGAFFDLLEEKIHITRYLLQFFVSKLRTVYENDKEQKFLGGL